MKVGAAAELAAVRAPVGLLASVDPLVGLQVGPLREALAAFRTCRASRGVDPAVDVEVGAPAEALAAALAAGGFSRCEWAGGRTGHGKSGWALPALRGRGRASPSVDSLVGLQVGALAEALPALRHQ